MFYDDIAGIVIDGGSYFRGLGFGLSLASEKMVFALQTNGTQSRRNYGTMGNTERKLTNVTSTYVSTYT